MTDTTTKKPIHVWSDGKSRAYIMLPVSQLDEVRRLLDDQRIGYRVGEYAISLNGNPEAIDIILTVEPMLLSSRQSWIVFLDRGILMALVDDIRALRMFASLYDVTFDEYYGLIDQDATCKRLPRRSISMTYFIEGGITMTDVTTKKPLRVLGDSKTRPYIMLPVSQLDEVRRLLDSRAFPHWVGEHAISLNGAPEVIDIYFERRADVAAIQAILDSVG